MHGHAAQEIAGRYRRFADTEAAGVSDSYHRWASHVAASPHLVGALGTLPTPAQQPNLVFAAARLLGAVPGDGASLDALVADRWEELLAIVTTRSTQTNEVGRCAALLPVLASLPQPLALLEVGAAAGLCLHPDRYSYRYVREDGRVDRWDPPTGVAGVELTCQVRGDVPVPARPLEIAWRAGIDLNPLDPADAEQAAWLQALVWPEQDERRERLGRALAVAASERVDVARADLTEALPDVAARAPEGATLVVFHSAVLAYVEEADQRRRFVETVRGLPGHWVSNEGRRVLDVPLPAGAPAPTPDTAFTLALDGEALALAQGHGRSLTWLEDS